MPKDSCPSAKIVFGYLVRNHKKNWSPSNYLVRKFVTVDKHVTCIWITVTFTAILLYGMQMRWKVTLFCFSFQQSVIKPIQFPRFVVSENMSSYFGGKFMGSCCCCGVRNHAILLYFCRWDKGDKTMLHVTINAIVRSWLSRVNARKKIHVQLWKHLYTILQHTFH